jgi:hypothetical protein
MAEQRKLVDDDGAKTATTEDRTDDNPLSGGAAGNSTRPADTKRCGLKFKNELMMMLMMMMRSCTCTRCIQVRRA